MRNVIFYACLTLVIWNNANLLARVLYRDFRTFKWQTQMVTAVALVVMWFTL